MSDQQIADLGLHARNALDNPALKSALVQLHELNYQAFKKCDIRDPEGLKLARQFAAVTDDFESILRRMIEGGKLAQLKLDQHRDENAARKAVRKFSR